MPYKKEDLLAMTKADLTAEYETVLKETPAVNLTKEALADAILQAVAAEEKPAVKEPTKAPEEKPAVKDIKSAGTEKLTLVNKDGRTTTMVKRTYDMLPASKYGWKIKKPSELRD